ncbi:MAG: S8 family serine peptidase [Pirellulales bacterium]|nr:S8 family serine peptidase [Pirellulales bacterium]
MVATLGWKHRSLGLGSSQRRRKAVRPLKFAGESLEQRQLLSASSSTPELSAILKLAATRPFVSDEVVVAIRTPATGVNGDALTSDSISLADDPLNQLRLDGALDTSGAELLLADRSPLGEHLMLYTIPLRNGTTVAEGLARLAELPDVAWAAPNFIYSGDPRDLIPNDPLFGSQYHHSLMQNTLAWDITQGSASIIVAVTDDGVAISHADLNANIWTNPGEIPGNGLDDDGNSYVDDVHGWDFSSNDNDPNPVGSDDHGTHVAGIIAADTDNGLGVAGTAGDVTLLPVRFYGSGAWTSSVIAASYAYAIDNGARIISTSYNVDGFVGDPTFEAALDYLYDHGGLHFNSSGNNSQDNAPRTVYDQSLYVNSTTSSDTLSSFSNYGTRTDISSPGSDILSTVLGDGYGYKSGTSMATPNAAAVAALIWSQNPGWNRDQVAAQLLGTADDIDPLNPGFVGKLGTGRVNSYRGVSETLAAPRLRGLREVADGGVIFDPLGALTVDLFNLLDAASVNDPANWTLTGDGPDDAFGTADDLEVPLTLATNYQIGTNSLLFGVGAMPYDHYEFRAHSGGLVDPFGTPLDGAPGLAPGDDFVVSFDLVPEPIEWQRSAPGGSLGFEFRDAPALSSAELSLPAYILAGQQLTISAVPDDPGATVTITVRNSGGDLAVVSSPAAGIAALLEGFIVPADDSYEIVLTSDVPTGTALLATLNLAQESESLGLASNDVLGTAQSLDVFNYALGSHGASRLAVTGTTDFAAVGDYYQFQVATGQVIALSLAGGGDAAALALFDSAGVLRATNATASGNLAAQISEFFATSGGVYYARVQGDLGGGDGYTLVVTLDSGFDREPNNALLEANSVGIAQAALGAVLGGSPLPAEVEPNDDGLVGFSLNDLPLANDLSGSFLPLGGGQYRAIVTGVISTGNDVDWDFFKIVASPGDTLAVNLDGVSLADPYLLLFDHFGNLLAANDDYNGLNSFFQYSGFAYVGDYYIVADSYSSNTGSYTLTANLTTPALLGTGGFDSYSFAVNAGDELELTTLTPRVGAFPADNNLDPVIELYDPSGALVATSTNGFDGRNDLLLYNALATGRYTARVLAVSGRGEYFLDVAGATGNGDAPFVVAGLPPAGTTTNAFPGLFRLEFNEALDIASIDPSDFTLVGPVGSVHPDSVSASGAVLDLNFVGGDTGDGEYTIVVEAGVVEDLQQAGNLPYAASFTVDRLAPVITASNILQNEIVPAGVLDSIVLQFSESLDGMQLDASDVSLVEVGLGLGAITPTSFEYNDLTHQVTVQYPPLAEGSYRFTVFSGFGQFADLAGNLLDGERNVATTVPSGNGTPGGNFVLEFAADVTVAPYPTPLEAKEPLGSLIYDPTAKGAIDYSGDVDSYTIDLDANQTISVVAVPRPVADLDLQSSFTIDSSRSTLLISGDLSGLPFEEQSPGSQVGTLAGELNVQIVGGLMSLLGGNVDFVDQAGPFLPGNAPGDFAVLVDLGVGDLFARAVSRGLAGTIDPMAFTLNPDGTFDPAGFALTATAGQFEYELPPLASGSELLAGLSLVVQPGGVGSVAIVGDHQELTVPFEALVTDDVFGLTLTLHVVGQIVATAPLPPAPLDLQVTLRDPSNNVVATADTHGPNLAEWIQAAGPTTAGQYTIDVSSSDGSTGVYELRVVLNAGIETETYGGATNDTAATAQSLQGTFLNLGEGITRGAVLGQLEASQYSQSHTQTNNAYYPNTLLFSFTDATPPVGDALLHIDAIADLDATSEYFSLYAEGYFLGNVFVDDGQQLALVSTTVAIPQSVLAQLAADGVVNIELTPTINVDFLGDTSVTLTLDYNADGGGQYDYYKVNVSAGTSLSIAATSLDGKDLDFDLMLGNFVLASGAHLASNVSAAIDNFVPPFTTTLTIRVDGERNQDYSLVVVRNGALSLENNDDPSLAQDITGQHGVLGHVSQPGGPIFDGADRPLGGAIVDTGLVLPDIAAVPRSTRQLADHPEDLLGSVASAGTTQQLVAADSPLDDGPIPLLTHFAGPTDGRFVPPDSTMAAGPEQVVAIVNTRIGIYDKVSGAELFSQDFSGPSGFFGSVGATTSVFDPWIVFDPDSKRFFAVGIDIASSNESNVFLAVSKDSTPTGGDDWWKYKLNFTDFTAALGSGAHFPDYEKLSVDGDAVWISGNYFPISSGSGVYAGITALDKASLLSGGPATIVYDEKFSGFSVFPVQHYGDAGAQYFVESTNGSGSTLRIHAITNVLTSPTRVATTLAVPSYGFPVDVPQFGSSSLADSVDSRIMTGVWRDGSLWVAHSITEPTVGDGENVVRWYQIETNGFGGGGLPALVQAGNVDPGPGEHAWMPAITVDGRGNMGLAFALGGPTQYFSAAYTGRLASDPAGTTVLPVSLLREGVGNYSSFRWGDYTGISIDPSDDATIWIFNEYAALGGQWATEIGAFQLQSPEDNDWYDLQVNAGDELSLETSIPADGLGEFVNLLDPRIELYDPNGELVASDDDSGAGVNALLTHTALLTGNYKIRVLAAAGTEGEYVLYTRGSTADDPAVEVIDVDPDNGQTLTAFPATVTLDFSEQVLDFSVDPGDVFIGGLPATGVHKIDGDTFEFTVNPEAYLGDGVYEVVVIGGGILDLQYSGIQPFNSTFIVDTAGPRIVATRFNGNTLDAHRVIDSGPLVFEAQFNELLATATSARRGLFAPGADDVHLVNVDTLQAYPVLSVAFDPGTLVFRATFGDLPEGSYELVLHSGDSGFEDLVGNDLDGEPLGPNFDGTTTGDGVPGGDYHLAFMVDLAEGQLAPFRRIDPLGGLALASLGTDDYSSELTQSNNVFSPNTLQFDFLQAVAPAGDAVLTLDAFADLDLPEEYLSVSAEGVPLGNVFVNDGQQLVLVTSQLVIPQGLLSTLAADGVIHITVTPSVSVNDLGGSSLALHLDYDGGAATTGVISYPGDADDFAFTAEGGESITARVSPNDPSALLTVEVVGISAVFGAAAPGAPVILPLTVLPADGTYQLRVTGDVPGANYVVEAYRNTQVEYTDTSDEESLAIDDSLFTLGSSRWSALGHAESTDSPSVDSFTLDLTGQTGRSIDVVLDGAYAADFSGGDTIVELLGVDGVTVLATASSAPGPFSPTNYDQAILGFHVPAGGVYTLRVTSSTPGDYTLTVLESLVFDTETNNDPLGNPLRSLQGVDGALGWLDARPVPLLGDFDFVIDSTRTFLTITGTVAGEVSIVEQSAGSLVGHAEGTVHLTLSPGSIRLPGGSNIDFLLKPGNFRPGNAPADLAGKAEILPGTFAYAAFRNLATDTFGSEVALNPDGTFDVSNLFANVLSGVLDYQLLIFSGSSSLSGSTSGTNQATDPGMLTSTPLGTEILVPIAAGFSLIEPNTGFEVIINLIGQVVAVGPSTEGLDPSDAYEFDLAEGQSVTLWTETPLDGSGLEHTLDPTLRILAPNGDELLFDDNGAGDGKNAQLSFTATSGGTYRVVVGSHGGRGEYLLRSEIDEPPQVVGVEVASTNWYSNFYDYLVDKGFGAAGYAVPDGPDQLDPLPWSNIDQVKITFSEDVVGLDADDLRVYAGTGPEPVVTDFSYDATTHTGIWTFQDPLQPGKFLVHLADSLHDDANQALDGDWTNPLGGTSDAFPSGDGTAGGAFDFRLNVLPGDVNQNEVINVADMSSVSGRLNTYAGMDKYSPRADINGDGKINIADLMSVVNRVRTALPPAEPTPPPELAAALDVAGSLDVDSPVASAAAAQAASDRAFANDLWDEL